jgi:hypothetical protein
VEPARTASDQIGSLPTWTNQTQPWFPRSTTTTRSAGWRRRDGTSQSGIASPHKLAVTTQNRTDPEPSGVRHSRPHHHRTARAHTARTGEPRTRAQDRQRSPHCPSATTPNSRPSKKPPFWPASRSSHRARPQPCDLARPSTRSSERLSLAVKRGGSPFSGSTWAVPLALQHRSTRGPCHDHSDRTSWQRATHRRAPNRNGRPYRSMPLQDARCH